MVVAVLQLAADIFFPGCASFLSEYCRDGRSEGRVDLPTTRMLHNLTSRGAYPSDKR